MYKIVSKVSFTYNLNENTKIIYVLKNMINLEL